MAENLIAYARAKGDAATERDFAALLKAAGPRTFGAPCLGDLFFFVPEPLEATRMIATPRVSYSAAHALVFERNPAPDPVDALAYTVYGFGKGFLHHCHRNGLAMELYGRGHVLGVDSGRAGYADRLHAEYLVHVAAHNAVVPNGQGGADGHAMDLEINAAEPAVIAGEDPTFQLSPDFQFTDAGGVFVTPVGAASQRRVMGIVRTGPSSGYYVDIFRSRMQDGSDTTHDYVYHNRGNGLALCGADGRRLPLVAAELDPASGPGYKYFQDVKSVATAEGLNGVFDCGISGILMKVWMPGDGNRMVYSLIRCARKRPQRAPTGVDSGRRTRRHLRRER